MQGLDNMEGAVRLTLPYSNPDHSGVQSVASRYTNWALPAPLVEYFCVETSGSANYLLRSKSFETNFGWALIWQKIARCIQEEVDNHVGVTAISVICMSMFDWCAVWVIPWRLALFGEPSVVGFEVFTAMTMKNDVFWNVTSCGSCKNRRFGGT
jgi:hypothetical protein